MKLLRPLHRQRTRRRNRFTVLGNEDLAAYYCVPLARLERHLLNHDLPFHKDSCGNLWATCPQEAAEHTDTGKPPAPVGKRV